MVGVGRPLTKIWMQHYTVPVWPGNGDWLSELLKIAAAVISTLAMEGLVTLALGEGACTSG